MALKKIARTTPILINHRKLILVIILYEIVLILILNVILYKKYRVSRGFLEFASDCLDLKTLPRDKREIKYRFFKYLIRFCIILASGS